MSCSRGIKTAKQACVGDGERGSSILGTKHSTDSPHENIPPDVHNTFLHPANYQWHIQYRMNFGAQNTQQPIRNMSRVLSLPVRFHKKALNIDAIKYLHTLKVWNIWTESLTKYTKP